MFPSPRFISTISQLPFKLINSQRTLLFPVLQRLNGNFCECRKQFQTSSWKFKDKIPSSVTSKYEPFTEQTQSVILDIEEEREKIQEEEIKDPFKGLNLQRGETGVFDLEEIVELLQREKAQDIFVVKIPKEAKYADYMIVVTGRSKRHMSAVFEFIRKVYKKKMSPTDIIPNTEGKTSNEWMALDLGNVVVHMFSKKARKIYDLESLWSVGREYDPLSQEKDAPESQTLSDYGNVLAKLIPDQVK